MDKETRITITLYLIHMMHLIPAYLVLIKIITVRTSKKNTNEPLESISVASVASDEKQKQTGSETIRNTGEIYWPGSNWYCKHCKLHDDRFYMEGHITKGTCQSDSTD
jgi:hypothetical protein